MDLIKNYESAKQALWDHVGFVEDWVVYAVDDRTDMVWSENGEEVRYAKDIESFNSEDGEYYVDEIYTQRFYSKWIYRGADLTMIFVDTHTDGNRFFAIYSNDKEVKNSQQSVSPRRRTSGAGELTVMKGQTMFYDIKSTDLIQAMKQEPKDRDFRHELLKAVVLFIAGWAWVTALMCF